MMDNTPKQDRRQSVLDVERAEYVALVVCIALGVGLAIYFGASLLIADRMSTIGRAFGLGIVIGSPIFGLCIAPIFRGFLWPVFAILYYRDDKR